MGFGGISIWQLLIVLAIVVLLFGTKRLVMTLLLANKQWWQKPAKLRPNSLWAFLRYY